MVLYYKLKKNGQDVMKLQDGKCQVYNKFLLPQELSSARLIEEYELNENVTYIYDLKLVYNYIVNLAAKAHIKVDGKGIYDFISALLDSKYVDELGYSIESVNADSSFKQLMAEMIASND